MELLEAPPQAVAALMSAWNVMQHEEAQRRKAAR